MTKFKKAFLIIFLILAIFLVISSSYAAVESSSSRGIISSYSIINHSTSTYSINPNDNGSNISINESTTIQEAFDYLNDNVGGNGTIYLNDNIYNGSGNVNLIINSNSNITIIRNFSSATGTIINGGDVNWGLNINSGTYITLINLTIANFYNNSPGGAIYASGTLNLINSTFLNNKADNKNTGGVFITLALELI